jgi:hypothetical protein
MAFLAVGALAMAQPATGSSVPPTVVPGNPSCSDLGFDFGFKPQPEPPPSGTYAFPDGINQVTITSDGTYFDWTSTLGIDVVIVKGGPNANSYVYSPEAFSDTDLHSPINPNNNQLPAISHIEFCYDYELTASKTAEATWYKTIDWTITKDVTPLTADKFAGESQTYSYTVSVTKTETLGPYTVEGAITVNNPTPFTVDFSVTDLVGGTPATVDCPSNSLDPGGSVVCSYSADLGSNTDGTNTATIISNNAEVDGAEATADYAFGDPTLSEGSEPEEINVTDTNGQEWGPTSGNATWNYSVDQTCSSNPAAYKTGFYTSDFDNTASIDETDDSDSETVTLNCYAPDVTKDATAVWTREFDWTIEKTVDDDSHTGFAGDTFTSGYVVTVNQTVTENFSANGTIYVKNPTGSPGSITVTVTDTVNGTAAIVDCGGESTSLTVASGATGTCTYTVDLANADQQVNTATATFNKIAFSGSADVVFGDPVDSGFPDINVTDTQPDSTAPWQASGDDSWTYTGDFGCPTDLNEYTDGVYTKSFPNTAEITETEQTADADVDVTCYIPAKAKVIKTTTEGDEDIGQFPFTFELKDPDGITIETKTLGTGGGTIDFDKEFRVEDEGTWTVEEVLPDGWVSTDEPCTFDIAFPGSADQTYTCEFENVEKSRVDLLKLTNGVETTNLTWDFAIYEGPDGFGGTLVASDSTPPALLDFGNTDLDPFMTYTLCELEVPATYSTFWQIDTNGDGIGDVAVMPYDPNEGENPSEDLGNRCVDLGANTEIQLVPGTTLHFVVDNQTPDGAPRTPGYWKNWNQCTGGNQQYTAANNGGWMEGFWLLEDVLDPAIGGGITWGDISITTCEVAVDILDKRMVGVPTIIKDGRKKASDPLHNLATHLLAAQLNFGAGACTTQEVLEAALAAEQLLDKYNFDGNSHDKLSKKHPDAALANQLADYLDRYNNGEFCGDETE